MAIKLNPDHVAARASHRALALEMERLGALKAVAGKPSFNCATARRAVEKAICANPELADLDREINAMNVRIIREASNYERGPHPATRAGAFIARRNAAFGRPDYDLRKAMRDRMKTAQWGSTVTSSYGRFRRCVGGSFPAFEPQHDRRRQSVGRGIAAGTVQSLRADHAIICFAICRQRGVCHLSILTFFGAPAQPRRRTAGHLRGADRCGPGEADRKLHRSDRQSGDAEAPIASMPRSPAPPRCIAAARPPRLGRNRCRHRQDPNRARAFRARGEILRQTGKLEAAFEALNQAIRLSLTMPTDMPTAATPSTMPKNTTAPSRTITRRCG